MVKELRIENKLLNFLLTVIFTEKSANKVLKKYGIEVEDHHNKGFGGLTVPANNNYDYFIIYNMDKDEMNLPYSIMVHEAKHVINMICIERGIELDPTNDEFECYFLGNLVNEIALGFQKFKNKEIKGDLIKTYL